MSWNENLNAYVTHVELPSEDTWSPSTFKRYLKGFKIAKEKLKERGITKLYGLCETKKEKKFNYIFGYKDVPGGIVLTDDGILNYLVQLEI